MRPSIRSEIAVEGELLAVQVGLRVGDSIHQAAALELEFLRDRRPVSSRTFIRGIGAGHAHRVSGSRRFPGVLGDQLEGLLGGDGLQADGGIAFTAASTSALVVPPSYMRNSPSVRGVPHVGGSHSTRCSAPIRPSMRRISGRLHRRRRREATDDVDGLVGLALQHRTLASLAVQIA